MARDTQTRPTQIATTIDPEVRAMLDDLCEKDQRTLSGQITWLVKQEVERRREEEAAETPTA